MDLISSCSVTAQLGGDRPGQWLQELLWWAAPRVSAQQTQHPGGPDGETKLCNGQKVTAVVRQGCRKCKVFCQCPRAPASGGDRKYSPPRAQLVSAV